MKEAKSRLSKKGISWDAAVKHANEYLPFAENYDPDYLDFMGGYARGSGLQFEDIIVLVCQGEKNMCTDIMVNSSATADRSVLAAHTEDWWQDNQKHVVLVSAKPTKGPSCLVVTLGGLELITGINSAGIAFSGNSLYQNDARIGVPKMFVSRRILASKRIEDALSAALPSERASSYNNNICHASGEMYCVEGSATDSSLLYPEDGYLVHTNHYLDPRMRKYEALFSGESGTCIPTGSGTMIRYNRARTLVKRQIGRLTIQVLADILSDHVNRPDSICCHPNSGYPPHERDKTLYAVVSDVINLEMHACLGNPCEGKWTRFKVP